jgi:hypothetical protein
LATELLQPLEATQHNFARQLDELVEPTVAMLGFSELTLGFDELVVGFEEPALLFREPTLDFEVPTLSFLKLAKQGKEIADIAVIG